MLPVRCYSCNKVIGQYQTPWENLPIFKKIKKDSDMAFADEFEKESNDFFVKENITRYCCKRMFLGFFDFLEDAQKYNHLLQKKDEVGVDEIEKGVKAILISR